ncbi:MAG: carbon storage regulator CsrA [Syntrophaceae bacterium]|jgi:carbon storage regulator|nr:carbon storage regulator CsrA [Syntrophaceae bacterium]
MLVLTRKSEQSVVVGSNIEVRVLGIRGDQVSLGFVAPDEISIYRKEVYEAIQQENLQAAHRGSNEVTRITDTIGRHLLGQITVNLKRKEGCDKSKPRV